MPAHNHSSESLAEAKSRMDIVGPAGYSNRDSTDDYVDAREELDGYKQIPCQDCDTQIWVPFDFFWDEWYCRDCKPEELRDVHSGGNVTVRL